jgi:hypothetical protein
MPKDHSLKARNYGLAKRVHNLGRLVSDPYHRCRKETFVCLLSYVFGCYTNYVLASVLYSLIPST